MNPQGSIHKQLATAYEECAHELHRFCFRRIYNDHDAWDIVQNAFLKMHRYLEEGGIIENHRIFLLQVAHNLIIDESRKTKRRLDQQIPLDDVREMSTDTISNRNVINTVHSRMEANQILRIVDEFCSDEDYNLFVLRHVNGLTPTDISNIMEMSTNCISVRLHRIAKEVLSAYSDRTNKHNKVTK